MKKKTHKFLILVKHILYLWQNKITQDSMLDNNAFWKKYSRKDKVREVGKDYGLGRR